MLAEKGISRDLCRQLLHSGRLLYGVPAGLIILGGWLLRTRCGLGSWIMVVAIVFGVFAGLYSMFHFLLTAARTMDPTAPRLPTFRHLTKGG